MQQWVTAPVFLWQVTNLHCVLIPFADRATTSVLLPRWIRQDQSPVTSWTWRTPFSGKWLTRGWRHTWTPGLHKRLGLGDAAPSEKLNVNAPCVCLQVHRHYPKPPSRLTLHLPIWEHVEHGFGLQHESGDGCIRWTFTGSPIADKHILNVFSAPVQF